jgi:hypothetical protein
LPPLPQDIASLFPPIDVGDFYFCVARGVKIPAMNR